MKRSLLGFCILVTAIECWAEALTLSVVPDHTNHLYRIGEEVHFQVSATVGGMLVSTGQVKAALSNFGEKSLGKQTFDLSKGNPFVICSRLDEPGFVRLDLSANGAKPLVWSVAYEPTKIMKGSPLPEDFDAFWGAARAKLSREIPIDAKMTKVNERSTADFDFYRISFATYKRRVHGYMSIPTNKKKLPFPVEVTVSAAGFGDWTNDMQGSADRISVFFSVYPWAPHWDWEALGLKTAYDFMNDACESRYGCRRYCTAGLATSREDYFFYPVLLGIDRAIDWIAARNDVDSHRFWYSGTSQGGGFGLYLAGLNRRFTRVALFVPAITDTMGYLKGRRSGWPQMVETFAANPDLKSRAESNAPYFDGANFASRIQCPVRIAVGFSDTTCPPCCVYATFNSMPIADKKIHHGFGMTHDCSRELYETIGNWLRSSAD